jgi:hypothetical protein
MPPSIDLVHGEEGDQARPFGDGHDGPETTRNSSRFSTTSQRPSALARHAPATKPRRTKDARPVLTVEGGTNAVTA